MKKIISFVLIIFVLLILIAVFKANVTFSITSGTVIDSFGKGVADAQIVYNYRCSSWEQVYWQSDNVTITSNSNGQFEIPSYNSFKFGNIFHKCSKQVIVYKEGYAAYKNMCMQNQDRIGKDWNTSDTINYCGDLAYVGPSTKEVSMRIDVVKDAPDYNPNLPRQTRY